MNHATASPAPDDVRPAGAIDTLDQTLCYVIVNPSKVSDHFHQTAETVLHEHGWSRVRWLETSVDDPGRAMTARAAEARPSLVLAAGGDGTVRLVASGLANTGIPLAIIPAGTGNLLARNLDLPLDEDAALRLAVGADTRSIDVVQIRVDGDTPDARTESFAVMAGVGIDAVIMDATDSTLKKKVGSLAYFVAAAKHVGHRPFRTTISVDGEQRLRRRAVVVIIGNVGQLQANIELIPGARPDDGLLNVLVASPRSPWGWIRLLLSVLRRRHRTTSDLDHLVGSTVTVTLDRRHPYQMDGDTVGDLTTLVAEVQHHALLLKAPPRTSEEERT